MAAIDVENTGVPELFANGNLAAISQKIVSGSMKSITWADVELDESKILFRSSAQWRTLLLEYMTLNDFTKLHEWRRQSELHIVRKHVSLYHAILAMENVFILASSKPDMIMKHPRGNSPTDDVDTIYVIAARISELSILIEFFQSALDPSYAFKQRTKDILELPLRGNDYNPLDIFRSMAGGYDCRDILVFISNEYRKESNKAAAMLAILHGNGDFDNAIYKVSTFRVKIKRIAFF